MNTFEYPQPSARLRDLSLGDLSLELVARLAAGDAYDRDKDLVIAGQLQHLLAERLDVHLNRFARRRLYDLVRPILDRVPVQALKGATIVDLGSGSLNPFAFGFLFLALGAARAYVVDLEPPQDPARAFQALATAAGWILVDPDRVIGPHTIPATAVLEHLAGFDLARLSAGDPNGVDSTRLIHRIESVYDLSVPDGEADLVSTVSLLEHLDRIDDALEALRRITRPGGAGHHIVDFIDHRVYGGQVRSPFEFLKIESSAPLVHGCNRIRCGELCTLFDRHGFDVEEVESCRTELLTEEEQRQFSMPYRTMDRRDLAMVCARIIVRRR